MENSHPYPAEPVEDIAHAVMLQGWRDLTYLHWPYDPAVVQARLPAGVEVDVFEHRAWVGLVAFRMQRIRLPRTPAVPYLGPFPETKVRTYVRGPDGTPGVWFDSLDITRLLPVIVAKASYRIPYMWSQMSIWREGRQVSYAARRRWPARRGATELAHVRRGRPIAPHDTTELEHFLTARWGLYTQLGSRLAFASVEHPAWPLESAAVEHIDDQLIEAAGYPAPRAAPLVHYSPGIEVRIGRPRWVDSVRTAGRRASS